VILLDEPTVGVDPQSRERVFEAVTALAGEGAAILYSTHAMEEAERLCRRIVLLDLGRVIASGTPAELVAQTGLRPSVRLRTASAVAANVVEGVGEVRLVAASGRELVVEIGDSSAVPAVLGAVTRRGAEILEMSLQQPNLADVFFALTGRALRDDDGGSPA
jgi:ABC-2 type transport system ATP-binding protein